jgi:hypothetical protein
MDCCVRLSTYEDIILVYRWSFEKAHQSSAQLPFWISNYCKTRTEISVITRRSLWMQSWRITVGRGNGMSSSPTHPKWLHAPLSNPRKNIFLKGKVSRHVKLTPDLHTGRMPILHTHKRLPYRGTEDNNIVVRQTGIAWSRDIQSNFGEGF